LQKFFVKYFNAVHEPRGLKKKACCNNHSIYFELQQRNETTRIMSLTRWFGAETFDDLFDMQKQMNKYFSPEFADAHKDIATWRPKVDVRESEKQVVLHAELPGLSKDEVHVELDKGVLTISGERKFEKKEEKEQFHRIERSYGKFQRSFAVPDGVDSNAIQASFNNGVLEVVLPKPEKKSAAAKINIQ
jgi:HSP20 family protein